MKLPATEGGWSFRRATGVLALVLLGAGCGAPPERLPGPSEGDAGNLADDPGATSSVAKDVFELLSKDFTSRQFSIQLSNDHTLLKKQVGEMEVKFEETRRDLARALQNNPAASEKIQAELKALGEGMAAVQRSIGQIERDLDSVFSDIESMRREFRAMLQSLEAYRNAQRESLVARRDAMREEMQLLDSLLENAEQSAADPGR